VNRKKPTKQTILHVAICRDCQHIILERGKPCEYCGRTSSVFGILGLPTIGRGRPLLTLEE